jgi:hypothetical protein
VTEILNKVDKAIPFKGATSKEQLFGAKLIVIAILL